MGSGHILVYAFDVLMQIYTAAGWDQREAAQSILKNNLFGLDIDDRAAQLAYFAVMMKARQHDRRLLTRGIQPNIYSIRESNGIQTMTIEYFHKNDPKLKADIESIVTEMRDAKEYGSILNITPVDFAGLYARFDEIREDINMMQMSALEELLPLVKCAEVLAQKYDVVVTNPPYMGASGMNTRLAQYVKDHFPDTKADLFACFIERGNQMAVRHGYNSMVTMQSWMFLSSFEKMREKVLQAKSITNLMHMENMVMGIAFGTAVTVFRNDHVTGYKGTYNQIKLQDIENGEPKTFPVPENRFAQTSTDNFSKIPGAPVAYWASQSIMKAFDNEFISNYAISNGQNITGNNNMYLRLFWEVDYRNISNEYWAKCARGGGYRKYYGNDDNLILWTPKARQHYKSDSIARIVPEVLRFRSGITWSYITSGEPSFRRLLENELFEKAGTSIFVNDAACINGLLGLLNSVVAKELLKIISPTINYQVRDIFSIPVAKKVLASNYINYLVDQNTDIEKMDWDSYETSWDFKRNPLV